MTVERPDQVWSTDITYVPLASGFMYLAAVIDWFSRYVICLAAVEHAGRVVLPGDAGGGVGSGRPEMFNTDQGVQFTAAAFTGRLESAGWR